MTSKQPRQHYAIGMVGLGVMGRNLLLNMADHGHSVVDYDKDAAKGSPIMRKRAFSWVLRAWSRLGIRTARMEGRMARGDLMLRLYRFRDLPALRCLIQPEIFPAASGSQVKAFGSSASLWWWVCRTFQVFYVIEIDKREGRRMIGFAGVYNMEPRNSLWVSLVIFDPKDRRHGYGRRALELLLSSFQKNHVAKMVCGEVLASNTGSVRFLRKLGFDIFAEDQNRVLLNFEFSKDHHVSSQGV